MFYMMKMRRLPIFNDLKTEMHLLCFVSLQDSMANSCAEGISEEHYQLEGKALFVITMYHTN